MTSNKMKFKNKNKRKYSTHVHIFIIIKKKQQQQHNTLTITAKTARINTMTDVKRFLFFGFFCQNLPKIKRKIKEKILAITTMLNNT